MRIGVIVKLVILFLTLALVVWASIIVRKGSMEGFFASVTGIDNAKQINLCRNRIHSLDFGTNQKIEESQSGGEAQWSAYEPNPRPLNYLSVEKWLGEHCYVDSVERNESMEKLGPFQTIIRIGFIDGQEASLMQNSANSNIYSWDGRFYESTEMTSALAELKALAGWK